MYKRQRLGLCSKSLVVVPNHLTEQWGAEWLQLYPGAKDVYKRQVQDNDIYNTERSALPGPDAGGTGDSTGQILSLIHI